VDTVVAKILVHLGAMRDAADIVKPWKGISLPKASKLTGAKFSSSKITVKSKNKKR
jgi:4-hydroxy-3-polyprenylbenzoate decarboxylase